MRPPAAPPLLLVATSRLATESHRSPGAPPAPRIEGDVRHVHIEHLSDEDAERLVEGLIERLPNGRALRGAIRSIVSSAKGHSLFIDELVRQQAGAAEQALPTGPSHAEPLQEVYEALRAEPDLTDAYRLGLVKEPATDEATPGKSAGIRRTGSTSEATGKKR
jgi:hypothetical protein